MVIFLFHPPFPTTFCFFCILTFLANIILLFYFNVCFYLITSWFPLHVSKAVWWSWKTCWRSRFMGWWMWLQLGDYHCIGGKRKSKETYASWQNATECNKFNRVDKSKHDRRLIDVKVIGLDRRLIAMQIQETYQTLTHNSFLVSRESRVPKILLTVES